MKTFKEREPQLHELDHRLNIPSPTAQRIAEKLANDEFFTAEVELYEREQKALIEELRSIANARQGEP